MAIDYKAREIEHWARLTGLLEKSGYETHHVLSNWASYVRRRDMVRFLAHYELFKHVVDLPGCVVECGVFHGASFFTWAKLMETFCPGDRSRRVYGFDHYKGLHDFHQKDGAFNQASAKVIGGYASSLEAITELTALHNSDGFLPDVERCHLINGDVCETIPKFIKDTPGLRLAILHLDMDLYEPTKIAIDHLYDLVLPGGVIILDEFALRPWEGETLAWEEFAASRGIKVPMRKFPFTQTPHGYIIKE